MFSFQATKFGFFFFNFLSCILRIGSIYDFGFEKCKKKQRLEAATQSQKGALHRSALKESKINFKNQTLESNNIDEIGSQDDHGNIAVQGESQVAKIG
jgi:hypothetical protein